MPNGASKQNGNFGRWKLYTNLSRAARQPNRSKSPNKPTELSNASVADNITIFLYSAVCRVNRWVNKTCLSARCDNVRSWQRYHKLTLLTLVPKTRHATLDIIVWLVSVSSKKNHFMQLIWVAYEIQLSIKDANLIDDLIVINKITMMGKKGHSHYEMISGLKIQKQNFSNTQRVFSITMAFAHRSLSWLSHTRVMWNIRKQYLVWFRGVWWKYSQQFVALCVVKNRWLFQRRYHPENTSTLSTRFSKEMQTKSSQTTKRL